MYIMQIYNEHLPLMQQSEAEKSTAEGLLGHSLPTFSANITEVLVLYLLRLISWINNRFGVHVSAGWYCSFSKTCHKLSEHVTTETRLVANLIGYSTSCRITNQIVFW